MVFSNGFLPCGAVISRSVHRRATWPETQTRGKKTTTRDSCHTAHYKVRQLGQGGTARSQGKQGADGGIAKLACPVARSVQSGRARVCGLIVSSIRTCGFSQERRVSLNVEDVVLYLKSKPDFGAEGAQGLEPGPVGNPGGQ